jgi:hypothetical protein
VCTAAIKCTYTGKYIKYMKVLGSQSHGLDDLGLERGQAVRSLASGSCITLLEGRSYRLGFVWSEFREALQHGVTLGAGIFFTFFDSWLP